MQRSHRAPVREQVYAFIVRYAAEHNGVTPSYSDIARAFHVVPNTARQHVLALASEAEPRLHLRDRKIVVAGARWTPPPDFDSADGQDA